MLDSKHREALKAISPEVAFDEPMKNHTSFKIGGPADALAAPGSVEEVQELIRYCREAELPLMMMGNGSNMLVSDKGIRGMVIQIGDNFAAYAIVENTVRAQAGILLSRLAKAAAQQGLSGLEAVSGIPGTLGGGIYMNAGAYGGELKDVIQSVTYLTREGVLQTAAGAELEFGYRHSRFSDGTDVILECEMTLTPGNLEEIREAMKEYTRRRCEKQPLEMPSAGSTFKRPEGYFAGKLIQDAGLVGYTIGGAQVSEKHAGFVVNKGDATAQDVLALIRHIQKTVKEASGVTLEPEVRLIGEE